MGSAKISARLARLEQQHKKMILPNGRCAVCADHRLGRIVFVVAGADHEMTSPTPCPACGVDTTLYFVIQEAVDPRLASPAAAAPAAGE